MAAGLCLQKNLPPLRVLAFPTESAPKAPLVAIIAPYPQWGFRAGNKGPDVLSWLVAFRWVGGSSHLCWRNAVSGGCMCGKCLGNKYLKHNLNCLLYLHLNIPIWIFDIQMPCALGCLIQHHNISLPGVTWQGIWAWKLMWGPPRASLLLTLDQEATEQQGQAPGSSASFVTGYVRMPLVSPSVMAVCMWQVLQISVRS